MRMAEKQGFEAPLREWRQTPDAIRQAVLEQGFSHKLNSFVQSFDSQVLAATSLLIPLMEFLPADDPRVEGTVRSTLDHLTADGLVYRYIGDDGLPGKEGAFVLCTFWLVDALVMSGQLDKAEGVLSGALEHASPLGLFAEEIDPETGDQLGNYPQAFSHIGLMSSALRLGWALATKRAAEAKEEGE